MIRVYGCRISYYTGKLETYLRYRSIPYESLPTEPHRHKILEGAGVVQMPIVELDDGQWMSDSSPMIAWFESQQSAPWIFPEDEVLRFAALLVEDYADEWLWRPAMHYRWSYRRDREYASAAIVDEILPHMKAPRWLKRRLVTRRQRRGFVLGDGVSSATWDHVEQGYLNALDLLEAIFEQRPYLFGDRPTIADFGLMGPMLRHFGQDPTPQEIMRTRAPGVYEWVARMWNTRAEDVRGLILAKIDPPLAMLLREVGETHLAQLRQNAEQPSGTKRYDQEIQGVAYTRVPWSRYRVWCLEELRREWADLGSGARDELRKHLPAREAAVLWDDTSFEPSEYDVEMTAPFNRGINVFGQGVPPR